MKQLLHFQELFELFFLNIFYDFSFFEE